MISKVDYCISLYVSLPNYLLRKLQPVINRSAIFIYSPSPQVPTTLHLIELHWLPVKARTEFEICLSAFNALKFDEHRYIVSMGLTLPIRYRFTADCPKLHNLLTLADRLDFICKRKDVNLSYEK